MVLVLLDGFPRESEHQLNLLQGEGDLIAIPWRVPQHYHTDIAPQLSDTLVAAVEQASNTKHYVQSQSLALHTILPLIAHNFEVAAPNGKAYGVAWTLQGRSALTNPKIVLKERKVPNSCPVRCVV